MAVARRIRQQFKNSMCHNSIDRRKKPCHIFELFFSILKKRRISLLIFHEKDVRSHVQYKTGYRLARSLHTLLTTLGDFLSPNILPHSRLNYRLTHSLHQFDGHGLVLCVVGQRGLAELTANTRLLVTTEGPGNAQSA